LDPITLIVGAVVILGLAFGSFLNVCIYRMPRGLSVVAPRSACPNCRTPIAAYDNIPVLSWILLGGKCRKCKAPISPRYAIVELLNTALFVACVLTFSSPAEALKYMTFSFILLGLIFTDCENRILPDVLTLPGFVLGLVFSLLVQVNGFLGTYFAGAWSWRLLSLGDALLGAILGAGFIWAVGELYFRLRGIQGMGFGDVKLLLMIGAFLGPRLTLFTICASSVSAAVIGLLMFPPILFRRRKALSLRRRFADEKERRQEAYQSAMRCMRLPFGSFLGAAALFAAFYGDRVINWYVGFF
jgi:leader peptidase (prepilin peptidase)/N-methyltransferase